jgi:hypothetical protein
MTSGTESVFPVEGSILVVAHPDDEILWLGSVVAEVAQIVISFVMIRRIRNWPRRATACLPSTLSKTG